MVSEYLGNVAPFYISRYRLQLLGDRVAPTWRGTLSGKLAIPGAGEVGFTGQGRDKGTIRVLERILSWLTKTGAIGDAWDGNCDYTWIHIRSHIAWIENISNGIDHLVATSNHSLIPDNWCIFLTGLRTNLMSLEPADKYSRLGSSPLAIQAVLNEILKADRNPSSRTPPVDHDGTCERLREACHSLSEEEPKWEMAGVVEVVHRCVRDDVLLGSPLFLSSFVRDPGNLR
jgi:hypothetical protein